MACPNRTSLNPLQQPRTIATLEQHIKSLEAHYDRCQEAKLHSEVSPDEEPFDFKVGALKPSAILVGVLQIGG